MLERKTVYSQVKSMWLECTCVNISQGRWDQLMQGAVRANKTKVNQLVSIYLPELYRDLSLKLNNPYKYLITKKHIIVVHSAIEYFIRYEI